MPSTQAVKMLDVLADQGYGRAGAAQVEPETNGHAPDELSSEQLVRELGKMGSALKPSESSHTSD
jgi:hypothetical protein